MKALQATTWTPLDRTLAQKTHEKRPEPGPLLQDKVEGALVRSRFLQLEDLDAATSFLLGLVRSAAQRTLSRAPWRKDHRWSGGDKEPCSGILLTSLLQPGVSEGTPWVDFVCFAWSNSGPWLPLGKLTGPVNLTASSRAPGMPICYWWFLHRAVFIFFCCSRWELWWSWHLPFPHPEDSLTNC